MKKLALLGGLALSLMASSLLFQLAEMVTYEGRPPNDLGGLDCIGLTALRRYYACADPRRRRCGR